MEKFLNIDWNLPLNDIIDNSFLNEERLEKESVMHRIMTGNFTDPFKNIEEDYKYVKSDLMKGMVPDLNIKISKLDEESNTIQTKRSYIPGIVKSPFKFPKKSQLNKEQQATCLRVLIKFSESNRPKLNQTEKEDLQSYMELQKKISEEQNEFLEFAKSKWQERSFSVSCENFINAHWRSKMEYAQNLPRYYTETTNVPFISDKNVDLKFISTCLEMGKLPKITLPNFTKRCVLCIKSEQLLRTFPPNKNIPTETSDCWRLPVSEDANCNKLAMNNNVDLVISSSGLNCLVNNFGPKYTNTWILPVVIKRQNEKNVIYVNKRLPPAASTVQEKNSWLYKYVLRYFMENKKFHGLKNVDFDDSFEAYNDDIFDDINGEELLRLEEKYDNPLMQITETRSAKVLDEHQNATKTESLLNDSSSKDEIIFNKNSQTSPKRDSAVKDTNMDSEDCKNEEDNVSYKLFNIAPQSSEQSELMKNVGKEYKVLVRTKTSGYEILEDKTQRLLMMAPKLEHQADFGAEAVTLEEASRQWISLMFRPDTFLARVRINVKSSEILQIENRTATSLNNEIKRLYNINIEDALATLHNLIQSLENLPPGRYIIRHTVRNGAFAEVFKEVENPGKNVFDIHTVYGNEYHSLLNSPWIPLDKTIATPMHKCFERMPAMFFPSNNKAHRIVTKKAKAKMPNTGTVRRSLRKSKKI